MLERIKKLLSEVLTQEEVEKAINYYMEDLKKYGCSLEELDWWLEKVTASEFLGGAFVWGSSAEGNDFWETVYDKLVELEKNNG